MAANNDTPLVSVIIPVYNGAAFVGETIESALKQTCRNIEVIVVDDGSTDNTLSVLNKYAEQDHRVRVISQPNGGVSKARNTAIAAARGEFIAPLDADDLWLPAKLDRQLKRMNEAGPETGIVYSWWAWIDEAGNVVDRSPRWTIEGNVLDKLMYINFVGNASVPLFRKSHIEELGGYKSSVIPGEPLICEDYELALRIAAKYRVVGVPDILMGYRRSAGSRSTDCDVMWRSQQAVMQSIRERHPELKPALFEACNKQFCMYVAGLAYMSGNTKEAIRWGLRSGPKLPLLIAPYVLKMMFPRRKQKRPMVMRPGRKMDTTSIPAPLFPYDLILSPGHLPVRLFWHLVYLPVRLFWLMVAIFWWVFQEPREWAAWAIKRFFEEKVRRDRLACEASGKPRVLATACWDFPIYSQTFVYRETLALVNKGYEVRFAYGHATSVKQLPDDLVSLWDLKRRIYYSDAASVLDFKYYSRRMPERVNLIIQSIAEAANMSEDKVIQNRHFLHAFSFARFAAAWQPEYIHTYFFYEAAVFGYVASTLLGVPRGVSCYADHMVDDYDLKLVKLHMATCDVVVATSARIKRELEELVGHPLPNAIVKPNGIDSTRFNAAPRVPSGPARVFKGVAVNRIHAKKGMTYLVEAVLQLRDRGVPFVMEILGEHDTHDPNGQAYFDELKKFVADNKLESSILFLGRQAAPEVRQHLCDGDIFVAPFIELANGDKDGIPTALLEGMAAGCAVVATDAGSITEVFDNGVEGLMVPQCNSTALADAIALLVADDALRSRLSQAAIQRIRRQFDTSTCEAIFHDRVQAAIEARHATPVAATR